MPMPSRFFARTLGVIAFCSLFALSAAARDRHSRNISTHGDEPVTSCADLKIEFDGRAAVMQSEERTLTKAEAPVLRATGETNGGIEVLGWDKNEYSVTLCKAAAPYADSAKLFAEIKLATQNGEVRVSGPLHDEDWTAYLLIRAPKDAALDLHVNNGPVGIYSVSGKITARAVNGPITARDCKGEVKLSAQNGPITAKGTSGAVELHTNNGPISSEETSGSVDIRTQNGPIEVALSGNSWNGSGLQAHAENGPLTIRVPHGYQSGVVIESDGRSPFDCRASVCAEGRKTWEDDKKRVEFGSGPTLVHASSVNGPISID